MSMLQGKTALVTGGSRGIGAATAIRLARAGADVALTYVAASDRAESVAAAITAEGRRAAVIRADVTAPEDIRAAVRRTVAAFGGLDILVNNAGIAPSGPFAEVTVDDIDHTLAVHPRASLLAAQAAAAHLPAGGRIINIGSTLAGHVPYAEFTLYAMSKSALVGLTKGLARDLGARDITVNLVHPGSTDTEMNPANGADADTERALTALGRYCDPADIAETVVHLAGPAGRNITGAEFTVDAGAGAVLAWILLLSAAVLEPAWATAIKHSDGLTRLWPSVFGLVGALASVVFLTFAMKTLPAGTAYSVFVGIGAIGVAAAGALAFNESVSPAKVGCLLLILLGVTGLHLIGH